VYDSYGHGSKKAWEREIQVRTPLYSISLASNDHFQIIRAMIVTLDRIAREGGSKTAARDGVYEAMPLMVGQTVTYSDSLVH
jgi:hypothetical protein